MIQEPTEFLSDDFKEAAEAPEILGRSELQDWAECPQKAAQKKRKLVSTGGEPATVGDEVHKLFAEAVKSRRIHGTLPHDLRNDLSVGAENSRPDVQPAVIDAVKYATWKFVDIITTLPDSSEKRNPEDLLRFDGGEGEMSGQLAADMEVDGATVRLTCEVDLLMSTVSIEELDLWDWKAGRKHWNATAVRSSFQFQFYAWMIFRVYSGANGPAAQRVTVRVFMPALSETTAAVTIHRRDMNAIGQRIKSAVRFYLQYHGSPLSEIPTWEEKYKCSICDAIKECPTPHREAEDKEGKVRQLIVCEAKYDRLKEELTEIVRETGMDIFVAPLAAADKPTCFGTGKPKASRAPTCSVYTPEGAEPAPVVASPSPSPKARRGRTIQICGLEITQSPPNSTGGPPVSEASPSPQPSPLSTGEREPTGDIDAYVAANGPFTGPASTPTLQTAPAESSPASDAARSPGVPHQDDAKAVASAIWNQTIGSQINAKVDANGNISPASTPTPTEPDAAPQPTPEAAPAPMAEAAPQVNIEMLCANPWSQFTRDWYELVKPTGLAQSDFTRCISHLVLGIKGMKHRENDISQHTRKTWVLASLQGRLNWMSGKITPAPPVAV